MSRALALGLGAALIAAALRDGSVSSCGRGIGTFAMALVAWGSLLCASTLAPPGWRRPVLIVSISMVVSAAAAELALEATLAPMLRPPFQTDEHLIFRLTPDRESVFRRSEINGGQRITSRINSAGYRGEELRTGGSALRVVVYGDSFIHAAYTESEHTFVGQLEAELADGLERPVEVVNAGVASYGPDQIALRIEREVEQLSPDLAIVAIFAGNDFGDLERNKLFRLDAAGELVPNAWHLAPDVACKMRLNATESILKRALRHVWRRIGGRPRAESSLPNGDLLGFFLERARQEHDDFVVRRSDEVVNTHEDYFNADVALRPHSDSAVHRMRMMDAVMQRIADALRDRSIPLLFVFVPHPVDVCESYDFGPIRAVDHPDYRRSGLTDALAANAERARAPFVNLFDLFRTGGADRLYFRGGDDHWNDEGQQLAARYVARQILDRGMLVERVR